MTVSARAHAHYPPRRKERELVRLRRFSFLRDLIVFCWSHSRTRKPVEYASPGRAQGGAGTDRGCFLAIHPVQEVPDWLRISKSHY